MKYGYHPKEDRASVLMTVSLAPINPSSVNASINVGRHRHISATIAESEKETRGRVAGRGRRRGREYAAPTGWIHLTQLLITRET